MTERARGRGVSQGGPARRATSWRAVLTWSGWFALLAALTVTMLVLRPRLDKAHIALAFLLTVLGASAHAGRRLGLTIAGAAFVAFNAFFLPPYATLVIADPLDWLILLAFLVTSIVAAQLLYRARATADAALQRAAEVDRLATLGAETLSAPGAEEALQAIVTVIRDAMHADECEVIRRSSDGRLLTGVSSGGETEVIAPLGVATALEQGARLPEWVEKNGRAAAELVDGTIRLAPDDSLEWVARIEVPGRAAPRAILLPLVVREQTVGVLRLTADEGVSLGAERRRLLAALAYYAALGVERVRLVETAERAESERRVESLRSALLTAVSHDLRTPLTTIKGIAHEVATGGSPSRALVIEEEADRLEALVGDLLDLSRIQAGAVRPVLAVNTIDELVGAALQRAGGALAKHQVTVELPHGALLTARCDFSQTLRILVNLLENAAKYAPPGSRVELRGERVEREVLLTVLDRGPGIPASERERIFEPFYRPPGTPADIRGTGLGLSIARGLAEAQGGAVRYLARAEGGAAFELALPAVDDVPGDGAPNEPPRSPPL